ncbi:MAG: hypothetical protein V3S16_14270 [Candidatus Desulfatibia sp.]|uniref:hypothetical protein n=1 Tax=Candidatus Desulfatibia sp. TaxID=3101189 RepID=UPI002F33F2BA
MSLKADIDNLIAQSSERIPPEVRGLMAADTERLKQSGIEDNSLKAGDKAPSFKLPSAKSEQISLGDLLAKGPLVLSFYRGGW